jgi:hypothetical protein
LLPISFLLLRLPVQGDLYHFLSAFAWTNGILLVFNILPIYPLDGGQILQSLLWFVLGRGRSMAVATVIGFVGVAGLGGLAIYMQSWWTGAMAFYIGSRCWLGWKAGVLMRARENARPRPLFACPACASPPLIGKFWQCSNCQASFDTYETGGVCPSCGNSYQVTECASCQTRSPIQQWGPSASQSVPVTPWIQSATVSGQTDWM